MMWKEETNIPLLFQVNEEFKRTRLGTELSSKKNNRKRCEAQRYGSKIFLNVKDNNGAESMIG